MNRLSLKEYFEKIKELIFKILPKNAVVLILSHTGSRAYGWGSDILDIDVRGIFYVEGEYWDWVHIGKYGYDITMESLEHVKNGIYYKHFTPFTEYAKPFYIHPAFDYESYMKLCRAEHVKHDLPSIKNEILRFKYIHRSARAGLHCYRKLMVPIYFLETGKIEIDCAKLNKEVFHFKQFDLMLRSYKYHEKVDINWDEALKDYDKLLSRLNKLLEKRDDKLSNDELNEFFNKTINKVKNVKYTQKD